ncbi:MAG: cell division/cell wall cluster transcriptional repressor MraZ [Rickettsiaceae bacterium]|nr:cell division/cell wall cluster transcriptional repressor MraZ [Rickettsiaceae bacterium]
MGLFLSKYNNLIDKKGRLSVPSLYRQTASAEGFAGVIIYPSIKNKALEGCSLTRINELAEMIYDLDPYSEERDAFETIILGQSVQLSFDTDGRIVLPKYLIDFAGLDGHASFVGKGKVFEIWNPDLLNEHLEKVQIIANNNKALLKNIHQGGEKK